MMNGWERIENLLPPTLVEIRKEICSLKYTTVKTLKDLMLCVEEALADPEWKWPKFHAKPNMASVFSKYMTLLCKTAQLSLLDSEEMEEDKQWTEIEGVLDRINSYVDAMIRNDEACKLEIRKSILKEEEQDEVTAMELDEYGDYEQQIESKEEDDEDEDEEDDKELKSENSESRGEEEDEEDDDIIVEYDDTLTKNPYVPTYNPRLRALSCFDLSEEERDFEDGESGEGSIPDYSDMDYMNMHY